MKLSTFLRAVVACVAVAYLIHALNWNDRIALPAGFAHDDFSVAQPSVFPARADADGQIVIEAGHGRQVRLPAGVLKQAGVHYEPGVSDTFARTRVALLAPAVALIAALVLTQATRWWILLRAGGIRPGFGRMLRAHLVGCFWNCIFPGLTGGDWVKAWMISRADRRLEAGLVSVVFDRVIGLCAIVAICAVAGIFLLSDAGSRDLVIRIWVVGAVLAVAALVWHVSAGRKLPVVSSITARMRRSPFLARLLDGLAAYHGHPRALFLCFSLSCVAHGALIGATIVMGRSLGIEAPFIALFVNLALVFLIGCLPISLFGLGVMEVAAVSLLGDLASINQIVGMLVFVRLGLLLAAIPGAIFVLCGDRTAAMPSAPRGSEPS